MSVRKRMRNILEREVTPRDIERQITRPEAREKKLAGKSTKGADDALRILRRKLARARKRFGVGKRRSLFPKKSKKN